ncbi:MAG: hypothetical protein JWM98_2255, partial [Thermoleophilia bacterium]|nr:hypothetical protein [Thermoleophilia bacterium]
MCMSATSAMSLPTLPATKPGTPPPGVVAGAFGDAVGAGGPPASKAVAALDPGQVAAAGGVQAPADAAAGADGCGAEHGAAPAGGSSSVGGTQGPGGKVDQTGGPTAVKAGG